MSRSLKVLSIMVTIVLLCTSIVYPATQSSFGSSNTSAPTVLLNIIGTVSRGLSSTGFVLTTEKSVVYNLTGNTLGIEKYLGAKLMVNGYIVYPNPLMKSAVVSPIKVNETLYVLKYAPISSPIPSLRPTPTPTPKPTPTPTPAPPINIKVAGTLSLVDQSIAKYALVTEGNVKYLLAGKTDGMNKYVNKKIVVSGYIQQTVTATNNVGLLPTVRPIIVVVEYYPLPVPTPKPKPTPKPTPTPTPKPTPTPPINVKLTGVVSLSDSAAYKYALTTEGAVKFLLVGKTDGMDKYINQKVIVVGYVQPTAIDAVNTSTIVNTRVFVVVEYYPVQSPTPTPVPTPTPTIKVIGTLSLSDNSIAKYILTTDGNVKYILTGKTDGMDKYINNKVVVVGYIQPTIATSNIAIFPPVTPTIVVVEYYPLPVSLPVPTLTLK